MARTLDVPELQVLYNYPGDGNGLFWHHRVLLARLGPGDWVGLTPDGDLERLDLARVAHHVCDRAAPFPTAVPPGQIYAFDPITRGELTQHKKRAKMQAAILGEEPVQDAEVYAWRFSDPAAGNFGEAVDPDAVDEEDRFTSLGDRALVMGEDGNVYLAEKVSDGGLAAWRDSKQQADTDIRLCPPHHDFNGRRYIDLREAVPKLRETEQADWPHEGPRCTREFLESVVRGPENLLSYHMEWLRASGVGENTAQAHEHRHACEVLRLATCVDQLDVSNCCSMEQITRRLVQLEMAVARNPRHPDYTGLGVVVDGPISAEGAARAPKFNAWVTDRQKEKAHVLKQQRLYAEEQRTAQRAEAKGGGKSKDYKKGSAAVSGAGP